VDSLIDEDNVIANVPLAGENRARRLCDLPVTDTYFSYQTL